MTLVPLIAVSIGPVLTAAAALALGAWGIALALGGRRRARGSTLVAPAVWTAVALAGVAAAECAIGLAGGAVWWADSLRYVAAAGTCCPMVAVLGAKRPQDGAWQFIVLSLWIVAALPALQHALFRAGEPLAVGGAWMLLAAALIALGPLNYLPTRHALSAALATAGQLALFAAPLGLWSAALPPSDRLPLTGLALLVAAAAGVAYRPPPDFATGSRLDRAWLEFRNAYGAAWALRVADRLRAEGERAGAAVDVGWHGFTPADDPTAPLDADTERQLAAPLRNLLRRFMAPEWLDARIAANLVEQPPEAPIATNT